MLLLKGIYFNPKFSSSKAHEVIITYRITEFGISSGVEKENCDITVTFLHRHM